jgi:hypothetical protein
MPQFQVAFEPETLTLLRAVLDEAWDALTPEERAWTLKSDMALRILRLAQQGERDPAKLRIGAMIGVVNDSQKRPLAPSVRRGSEAQAAPKQMLGPERR